VEEKKMKKILIFVVSILMLVTSLPVTGTIENDNKPNGKISSQDPSNLFFTQYWWPMYRADPFNTGSSYSIAPDTNLRAWEQTTGESIASSSPVVVDNKLYIGINQGNHGYLNCFNSENGTLYWRFSANGVIEGAAAVSGNMVYFAATNYDDDEAVLYCVNITTQMIEWTKSLDNVACCSPIILFAKLYICSNLGNQGKIYCFDKDTGVKLWDHLMNTGWIMPYNCTPAVWTTITFKALYFLTIEQTGNHVTRLFRVNADNGSMSWNEVIGESHDLSIPSIVTISGRAYVGAIDQNGDTNIYCYESDAGHYWNRVLLDGDVLSSSSPVTDGTNLYVIAQDSTHDRSHVYCLNALTGSSMWTPILIPSKVYSSPSVADGKLYFGSEKGIIYCLNTTTGDEVWTFDMAETLQSSPAIANQRVYIASSTGTITAFGHVPRIGTFSGGVLKVKVELMNLGENNFTNLTWRITVDGGFLHLIHRESTDTMPLLEAHSTGTIHCSRIFGLGKVQINATVTTPELVSVSETREGFILGPLVILK
jgi:outer membrane protein assembly factor BamB